MIKYNFLLIFSKNLLNIYVRNSDQIKFSKEWQRDYQLKYCFLLNEF